MAQTCDIFQGLHLSRLLRLLPSVCHLIKGVAGSSLFALFTIMGCWLLLQPWQVHAIANMLGANLMGFFGRDFER